MIRLFYYYKLSIKYWMQGDSWEDATALAKVFVYWENEDK